MKITKLKKKRKNNFFAKYFFQSKHKCVFIEWANVEVKNSKSPNSAFKDRTRATRIWERHVWVGDHERNGPVRTWPHLRIPRPTRRTLENKVTSQFFPTCQKNKKKKEKNHLFSSFFNIEKKKQFPLEKKIENKIEKCGSFVLFKSSKI